MAPKRQEVIRKLEDGYAIAWDTTDVSEEAGESFRRTADAQVEQLVESLDEPTAPAEPATAA
jgi:hypothetical protein